MSDKDPAIKDRTRAILLALSPEERTLFSLVVRLERENLHLKKPELRAELIRIVEATIK